MEDLAMVDKRELSGLDSILFFLVFFFSLW